MEIHNHKQDRINSATEKSGENQTAVSEFIFLEFAEQPEMKVLLFVFFLLIYVITILGMIMLIRMDPQLHTSMYLSNLAFINFCYSSTTLPKILAIFLSRRKTISFTGCFIQMYFFLALASTECILLGLMAYDRYVAICNPLLYPSLMSHAQCLRMVGGAFIASFLNSIIHTTLIGTLSFCQANEINHFFCDLPPLLKHSCSDILVPKIYGFTGAGTIILVNFLIIFISYMCIFSTVLKVNSLGGQQKAISTCLSHLVVVIMFYGTGLFVYLQPSSNYSEHQHKIMAGLYAFLITMLNPLVYSLKNKEVKDALMRAMNKNVSHIL
ncbi:olfactory receptor 5F1-like [Crotalus tigris]|uniref:olfactory receptor 5F1-like n=1 Tax=Crotalus tigris TaxID=88082 RepID=UPI00192F4D55|nr:olfactory receptor 5F1-like [Crotalus tigris]